MIEPLTLRVVEDGQAVFETALSAPLELGRQLPDEPGPYVLLPGAGSVRLVFARAEESHYSRQHLLLRPLPDGRVGVVNRGQMPLEVLGSSGSIFAGDTIDLVPPFTLVLGARTFAVVPGGRSTRTVAEEPSDPFARTIIHKEEAEKFRQARPRLRWVGVLSPLAGLASQRIRIDGAELIIGRDRDVPAFLADESVSRRHARIRRVGDEFILEDLGSSNGTHVDGVPVLCCVLRDGDTVEFGQNLFYFERVLETAGAEDAGQARSSATPSSAVCPPASEELTVRFWGTRGSIPTPGPRTEKYGGNTTCLELRYRDTVLLLDAGTGIRQAGAAWERESSGNPLQAHLLFTHVHWDHIQGFPFFAPAYRKGNALTIYGEPRPDGGVRELLGGQMHGSYFPVPLAAMQASLAFRDAAAAFEVGPVQVRTAALPHPGGCLGYRLEAGGAVFVLATDAELDLAALNREEVRADLEAPRHHAPELLDFFRGVDLLVIDCQYTDQEYPLKRGWGHNAVGAVVDLCAQARPDTAALFHHDPESGDDKVAALVAEVGQRLERRGVTTTLVFGAREGMALRVGKPFRPLPGNS
jgi:phosphoribosyl 1,2-cyclic phosphodiesterase